MRSTRYLLRVFLRGGIKALSRRGGESSSNFGWRKVSCTLREGEPAFTTMLLDRCSRAHTGQPSKVLQGGDLPTPKEIALNDRAAVEQLLEKHGDALFSADELAIELAQMDPM